MNTNVNNKIQRNAAKLAGIVYPISFVIVLLVNFGIIANLVNKGDMAETVRNLLTNDALFRLGIVGNIAYCVGVILVLSAFYVLLKPVHQTLALFAAISRFIHALTWLLVAINLFHALRLLGNADFSHAFGQEQLYALIRLNLSGSDLYYVGLLFWSLSAAVYSYLLLKTNYIHKALAIFGIVSSIWCTACTIAYYIFPAFSHVVNLWWFDSPMVIFELVLSVRLLVKANTIFSEIASN